MTMSHISIVVHKGQTKYYLKSILQLSEMMGITPQAIYTMIKKGTKLSRNSKVDKVIINGVEYTKTKGFNNIGFTFNYKEESVRLVNIKKLSKSFEYTYSTGVKTYPEKPYKSFNTMWVAYDRRSR